MSIDLAKPKSGAPTFHFKPLRSEKNIVELTCLKSVIKEKIETKTEN